MVEVEEADVDVSGDYTRAVRDRSQPAYVPSIRATYYVPFTGDANLFKCSPSAFTASTPAVTELRNDELVFVLMRPDQNVAATKSVLDHDLVRIKQHLKWVSNDAESFNATLLAEAKQQLNARRERIAQVAQSTESLGVPVRRKDSGRDPRLSVPTAAVRPRPAVDKYDVALSFAGEDRDYVEAVATGLRAAGVTVFYDKFVTADLWGKNLADHLADVYKNRSRFVVMFVSKHYVSKPWTTHERRHAQDRALVASQEYILPARFDDTEVPGITSTVGYVSLADLPPDALVDLILTKLKR